MAKEKKFYKRAFLNKGTGRATIEVDFNVPNKKPYKNEDRIVTGEGQIAISDCYRTVTLEFWVYQEKLAEYNREHKARIEKLDTLIKHLEMAKQFMLDNPPELIKSKKTLEKEAAAARPKASPKKIKETPHEEVVDIVATLFPVKAKP